MDVVVAPVPAADKAVLWDRFQDYARELTQYGTHRPVNGVFDYPPFDLYWSDPDRFAFWAQVDGRARAFALVHRGETTEMAEFYSFPEWRRTGIAMTFARELIRRFPGPWELTQYRANIAAVSFWRRAIADYSYVESVYVGGSGVERLRQSFVVPGG